MAFVYTTHTTLIRRAMYQCNYYAFARTINNWSDMMYVLNFNSYENFNINIIDFTFQLNCDNIKS